MAQRKTPKSTKAAAPENTRPDVQEVPAPQEPAPAPEVAASPVFDQAVDFVLGERIEGGYSNDPRDPGGETKFGIAKRSHPGVNIRALTREDAIAIYKAEYWDAARCDDLPGAIAVAVFDSAVNQGVGVAIRLLQKAAGVTADGVIGPKTLAAVEAAEPGELLVQFLGWRLRRYAFTGQAATFMRGWANRVLYLHAFLLTEFGAS